MNRENFSILCEVEPPTRPGFGRGHDQVDALSPLASAFFVPDSHIGRATVSSLAVAHEIQLRGKRSLACLNCRDRNQLGLRRDLLTAATYGIDHLLFVFGDRPRVGKRTSDLTVRGMVDEARSFGSGPSFLTAAPFTVGVAARLGAFPAWKREADFVFVQVSFSLDELFAWREELAFDGPIYAGVLVLQSFRTAITITDVSVPAELLERVTSDPAAGVEAACVQVLKIREHGGFAGVHLIPLGRYREIATLLGAALASPHPGVGYQQTRLGARL